MVLANFVSIASIVKLPKFVILSLLVTLAFLVIFDLLVNRNSLWLMILTKLE